MKAKTMRVPLALLLLGGALALVPVAAGAHECKTCPSFKKSTSPAVQSFAGLVGCWSGKGPNAVPAELSFEMGGDGTALLETMWVKDHPPVYTIYSLDGENLVANHYCSLGNQVKLQALAPREPKDLVFKYVDASNRSVGSDAYMSAVKFDVKGTTLNVDWTLMCDGTDGTKVIPQPFTFERVQKGCRVGEARKWSGAGAR